MINLGKVGDLARGIVFTVVGILVVAAAVTFAPDKARGLDAAVRQVAAQPMDRGCLACWPWADGFGAYLLAESRYRRL